MEFWKMAKSFSRPGKIMEFEKKAKIMEKSWNFKMMHHGKIMEFCFLRFSCTLLLRFFRALCAHLVISRRYRSWKMQRESWNIHGKIMEFHFGKWLETLMTMTKILKMQCYDQAAQKPGALRQTFQVITTRIRPAACAAIAAHVW